MAAGDRRYILHFDWTLFILVLALAGIGLVSVISASYGGHKIINPLVIRQLIWIAAGTAALLIAVLVDYRALQSYAYPFYVLVVGLLIAVMVAGHATGGSRRWINLGFFHLEPSELAKLAVVLVMVRYLREEPPKGGWGLQHLIVPFILLGVPAALVLKQPDLGTGLVLVLITITLIFVAGLNWRTMLVLAIAGMLAAPLSWHYLKPYQRQRLVSFINPQADPLGSGYHIIQSEIAIGAGGPDGQGISERHAGAAEFSARAEHRFYLRGFRRGVRISRRAAVAGAVCERDCARRVHCAACARPLRRVARGRLDGDRLLAGRGQHRDGDRDAAGGGNHAAAGELRRLVADRDDGGDGHSHQHQHPPLPVLSSLHEVIQMARKKKFTDPIDIEIIEVHARFVEVMENVRLETISPEMKLGYLTIMKTLTEKLAMPSKPLHEIMGEIMADAGPLIFQAMQR